MECEKLGVCPNINENICCMECERVECSDRCNTTTCEYYRHETGIAAFKMNAVAVINAVSELEQQKSALEEKSKVVREQLRDAMEKYGVMGFENEVIKVKYIASTTVKTLDTTRIKKELPEVAEKYTKTSTKSAYVTIKVK